jgi:putative DNA methylase
VDEDPSARAARAIESDDFPFEWLSDVAEAESWRKEVHRPIYHLHKWWAQRLGSVFRAAILGAAKREFVSDSFYRCTDLGGLVVFDPFMGSGTTVGEAAKLGCVALGRDINPVACNAVRVALGALDRGAVEQAYRSVEKAVAKRLRALYRSVDRHGSPCDVLYFFWVKTIVCPGCEGRVDLFSTYVFAKHAYPKRYPTVHIVCPACGGVFAGRHDEGLVSCSKCRYEFDPHAGAARGRFAVCGSCRKRIDIATVVRGTGRPPAHRLYAKRVLTSRGDREYMRATDADVLAYGRASRSLPTADVVAPVGRLALGHNTNQALHYNYREWADFFNDRQRLALGLLARAISRLEAGPPRDALALVFSGALEFNNLFATYKGEGTGAVRHMFSHHILKPERMPIEGNPWGLPQSSGAFSTLYRRRLLRALDYRDRPFEVAAGADRAEGGKVRAIKVFGASVSLTTVPTHPWASRPRRPGVYVSCGDSASTDLEGSSVDLVVTDPPFFDNVHYSELADFFFAWQRRIIPASGSSSTTRHDGEVQDRRASAFTRKLARVFGECHRVLHDRGLLVFSYHHSRDEGWVSMARALSLAGFSIVQSHPVKAEMSVAAPKTLAANPIDIDVLVVCRKRNLDRRPLLSPPEAMGVARRRAAECIQRFASRGRRLARMDVKVVLFGTWLRELSAGRSGDDTIREFERLVPSTDSVVDSLAIACSEKSAPRARGSRRGKRSDLPELFDELPVRDDSLAKQNG